MVLKALVGSRARFDGIKANIFLQVENNVSALK